MRAALFLVVLALAGCGESESERAARAQIRAIARSDWAEGVDVTGLAESQRLCETVKSPDCSTVEVKAREVADAVASCAGNDSTLCEAVRNTSGLLQFKGGTATPLPDHPFYWSLDNPLLDAQAPTFGYRGEMWGEWLARWRGWLLAAFTGLVSLIAGWRWINWREIEAENRAKAEAVRKAQEARQKAAQEIAEAEAARMAQEAAREAAEAQAKAEATRKAQEAAKAAAEAKAKADAKAAEALERQKAAAAAALAAFKKPKR